MPLYSACPCRNSKDSTPYMAQMMRIFIVVPTETISHNENDRSISIDNQKCQKLIIGIKPRVQPNPQPCPIFRPSNDEIIMLPENNIWVLRLP